MKRAIAMVALAACSAGSITSGIDFDAAPGIDSDAAPGGGRPVVSSFSASPEMLPAGGGQVTLTWSVSDADTIVIDQGVGTVTGTSVQVNVTATTVFTLTASNESGATTRSALVTVGAATSGPVILSFSATPATLPTGGGTTRLAWQVSNADSLSIDSGVGAVTGESVMTSITATTVFRLTATNPQGSATSTTAVVVGQNPPSRAGRSSNMVAPTDGETFAAPATLRLVASGRDPNIGTNVPVPGHGGNASKVQFFVDDSVVLEVDGTSAEYWIFKGFASGVPAGTHRVWARAIYVNPAEVLDSAPVLITVNDPPAYARTVDLTADVAVGAAGYELIGAPGARIRLNGNGYRITGTGASGPFTLKHVDVFDLGPRTDTTQAAINLTTSGAVTIEDSIFDTSSSVRVNASGAGAMSIRRNLFRSNMRMPIGQQPGATGADGTWAVGEFGGTGSGSKTFAGNNVGASYVRFSGPNWVVGGDSDADSNVLIGPRVGIYAGGTVQVRRNYSHHVYYGGWSQGSCFELGGGTGVVAEHNVVYGSSWPVRGVAGQFRYNLVLDAGHQWLWADNDGGAIHHNIFVGGEADIGGIFMPYSKTVRIYNNTIDGQGKIGRAVLFQTGSPTFNSNLLYRIPGPAVEIKGGSLSADYNLFYNPAVAYSDTRSPAHDVTGVDPLIADAIDDRPFDLDETGVWRRTTTVRDILGIYRSRYTTQSGSRAIDSGDPAGGSGNDIGALGAGEANADDRFGRL